MAKDPVCKMDVNEKKAKFKTEHVDKTFYFCNKAYMEKFKANPKKYL